MVVHLEGMVGNQEDMVADLEDMVNNQEDMVVVHLEGMVVRHQVDFVGRDNSNSKDMGNKHKRKNISINLTKKHGNMSKVLLLFICLFSFQINVNC
jgi:hypothetical protein